MILLEELGHPFVVENHVPCFHVIYRNMPFTTPGLEINDSSLHVKYGLKNVGMHSPKLNIISLFGFPWFRAAYVRTMAVLRNFLNCEVNSVH